MRDCVTCYVAIRSAPPRWPRAGKTSYALPKRPSPSENQYLAEHPRANTQTAQRTVEAKLTKLRNRRLGSKSTLRAERFRSSKTNRSWPRRSKLDGCYVLKTDLDSEAASKETIHDRYKDLAQVEWAFRTSKTTHLEVRPVHVRLESRTRAHVLCGDARLPPHP